MKKSHNYSDEAKVPDEGTDDSLAMIWVAALTAARKVDHQ